MQRPSRNLHLSVLISPSRRGRLHPREPNNLPRSKARVKQITHRPEYFSEWAKKKRSLEKSTSLTAMVLRGGGLPQRRLPAAWVCARRECSSHFSAATVLYSSHPHGPGGGREGEGEGRRGASRKSLTAITQLSLCVTSTLVM